MQESNNYTDFKILIFKITLAIAISLSTFSGFAQQNSGIELLRNGPMSQWVWVATNNHEDPIIFELERRVNDCDGIETVTIIKKTIYSSSKSDRGNTYIDDYGFNCSVSSKGDREHTKEYTILSRKFKEKKSSTSSSNTQTNSSDSYDYSSNESSYSSNSSYSNSDYSSSTPSESIYQKNQREATDKWDAQQKANKQATRDYYAKAQAQQQHNDELNAIAIKGINQVAGLISDIQRDRAANKARMLAEEQEERREAAERRLEVERLEAERRQAQREENERIFAQFSFIDNFYDKKIPVVVDSKEVFFIIISRKYHEKKIYISPFSLFANSENELPYKVDVIKDFKSKISRPYVYVQGPYKSLDEQKNAVAAFQTKARNNYVSYSLLKFTYKPEFVSSSNNNGDFWGEKKSTEAKSKKTIWD